MIRFILVFVADCRHLKKINISTAAMIQILHINSLEKPKKMIMVDSMPNNLNFMHIHVIVC